MLHNYNGQQKIEISNANIYVIRGNKSKEDKEMINGFHFQE